MCVSLSSGVSHGLSMKRRHSSSGSPSPGPISKHIRLSTNAPAADSDPKPSTPSPTTPTGSIGIGQIPGMISLTGPSTSGILTPATIAPTLMGTSANPTLLSSSKTLAQLQQLGVLPQHISHSGLLQGLSFNVQRGNPSDQVTSPVSPTISGVLEGILAKEIAKQSAGQGKGLVGLTAAQLSAVQSLTASSSVFTSGGKATGLTLHTTNPQSSSAASVTSTPGTTVPSSPSLSKSVASLAPTVSSLLLGAGTKTTKASQGRQAPVTKSHPPPLSTDTRLPTTTTTSSRGITIPLPVPKSIPNTKSIPSTKGPTTVGYVRAQTGQSSGGKMSADINFQGFVAAQQQQLSKGQRVNPQSMLAAKKLEQEREAQVQAIQKLQYHDFPLTTISVSSATSGIKVTQAKILKDLEKAKVAGLNLTSLEQNLLARTQASQKPKSGAVTTKVTSGTEKSTVGMPSLGKLSSVTTPLTKGPTQTPASKSEATALRIAMSAKKSGSGVTASTSGTQNLATTLAAIKSALAMSGSSSNIVITTQSLQSLDAKSSKTANTSKVPSSVTGSQSGAKPAHVVAPGGTLIKTPTVSSGMGKSVPGVRMVTLQREPETLISKMVRKELEQSHAKPVVTPVIDLTQDSPTSSPIKAPQAQSAGITPSSSTAKALDVVGPSGDDGTTVGDLKMPGSTGGDLKTPGAAAGDLKMPGASAGDLKTPGASAGDLKMPGATAGDLKTPVSVATSKANLPSLSPFTSTRTRRVRAPKQYSDYTE